MNKKMRKEKKESDWELKDLSKLPINAVRVLNVFIEKNKKVLDSVELQEKLKSKGITGRRFGATMAIFSKYSKESLVKSVMKVGTGNSRWLINEKYINLIKEYIKEVAPYLEKQ